MARSCRFFFNPDVECFAKCRGFLREFLGCRSFFNNPQYMNESGYRCQISRISEIARAGFVLLLSAVVIGCGAVGPC